MSTEKQGLICEECGKGPFKSLAGVAGHLKLAHGLNPGKLLSSRKAEQFVGDLEEFAERVENLEAVVSEVQGIVTKGAELVEELSKKLPERLDKVLAAHRERFDSALAANRGVVEKGLALLREQRAKELKPLLQDFDVLRRMYQSLDENLEKLVMGKPEAVREQYEGRIWHRSKGGESSG